MRHGVLLYEAMGSAQRLTVLPYGVFFYEATREEIEAHFNDMPYGAVKYARPKDMMAALLKGDG